MKITRRQSWQTLAAVAAQAEVLRGATASPGVRLVVLDVGGTIIQDHGDVPEAMIGSCAHYGIHIVPADVAPFRGASKREVIGHFVAERAPKTADRDKMVNAIYAEFNQQVIAAYRDVPPIDGVENAFREMRKNGILLATTTGFGRPVADSIFRRLNWEQYFVTTLTGDDVAQGRPAPFMIYHAMESAKVGNIAEVIAVGDTPLDIQAARNGGVRCIGVLSGVGTEEKLRAENPAGILPSVASLPDWLKKLS